MEGVLSQRSWPHLLLLHHLKCQCIFYSSALQCYINISPYPHIKIDEDDGFPPPDPHRLVNLIRVWPGWFFLVLAWFGHWLLLLLGAQISGLDPPAHILSVKGAVVENRLQKRPKKCQEKKAADAKNVTNP